MNSRYRQRSRATTAIKLCEGPTSPHPGEAASDVPAGSLSMGRNLSEGMAPVRYEFLIAGQVSDIVNAAFPELDVVAAPTGGRPCMDRSATRRTCAGCWRDSTTSGSVWSRCVNSPTSRGSLQRLSSRPAAQEGRVRSRGWTRTNNLPVNSRTLCQLSYAGSSACGPTAYGRISAPRSQLRNAAERPITPPPRERSPPPPRSDGALRGRRSTIPCPRRPPTSTRRVRAAGGPRSAPRASLRSARTC